MRSGDSSIRKEGTALRGSFATVASWLLVAVWAALIFMMSAQQSTGISSGFTGEIKQYAEAVLAVFGLAPDWFNTICHFIEYLILGLLLANALNCRLTLKKALLLAVLLASLYGASDEIHQYFVPTRVCDPIDWAVDTLGAFFGALGYACSLWLFRAFSHTRPLA